MRRSENMNLYINRLVAQRFREAVSRYDDRLGLCATAALLMFLESDPEVQGEYIRRIQESELRDQVDAMLQAVREEQARRVMDREQHAQKEKRKR